MGSPWSARTRSWARLRAVSGAIVSPCSALIRACMGTCKGGFRSNRGIRRNVAWHAGLHNRGAWDVGPTPFAGCRASTHRVMRIMRRGARFKEIIVRSLLISSDASARTSMGIIVNRLLGLLISYDAWHRHASLQLPWVCSSCDFLLQRLELIIFAIGLGPTRRVRTRNAIPP